MKVPVVRFWKTLEPFEMLFRYLSNQGLLYHADLKEAGTLINIKRIFKLQTFAMIDWILTQGTVKPRFKRPRFKRNLDLRE